MVSLAIVGIAGSAILLGAAGTMTTIEYDVRRLQAAGMAEMLMDEIAGTVYMQPGGDPYQTPLCANATELAGVGRSIYNDIDDYNGTGSGYTRKPPTDRWNATLGQDKNNSTARLPAFAVSSTEFSRWTQDVDIYYVSNSDLSTKLTGSQTSNYRAAQVRILYDDPTTGTQELAKLVRVFAYVPNN